MNSDQGSDEGSIAASALQAAADANENLQAILEMEAMDPPGNPGDEVIGEFEFHGESGCRTGSQETEPHASIDQFDLDRITTGVVRIISGGVFDEGRQAVEVEVGEFVS